MKKQGQALRLGWSRNACIAVVVHSGEMRIFRKLIQTEFKTLAVV